MDLHNSINKLNDMIIRHLKASDGVVNYKEASELNNSINLSLPKERGSEEEVFSFLDQYFEYSVKTSSPNFNNQLFAGQSAPAVLGELATAILNTSMATFEIAPVATLIESKLVEEFCNYVGYESGEGIMCTGGSNANMLALLAARNKAFPNSKTEGIDSKKLRVYVSQESHYSFSKAMNLMGLGINNLVKIESDNQAKLITSSLGKKIKEDLKNGLTPLMVAATAGTTVYGAIDPLVEVSKICKENNLWFHIDGAWGGSLLLSKKYKQLLNGSELSDSFTWDAHKLMNVPLIASFFLIKEKNTLSQSHSGGGSKYIFHEYENADYDTGPHSMQCGRRVDSLKIWLNFKYYGKEGYGKEVDRLFELRDSFIELIDKDSDFELMMKPETLNVCFRLIGEGDLNSLNSKVRWELVQDGRHLVNFSRTKDGDFFFRLIFANYGTKIEHLMDLLSSIKEIKEKLL